MAMLRCVLDRRRHALILLAGAAGLAGVTRVPVEAQAPGRPAVAIQGRVLTSDETPVAVRRASITVTVAGRAAARTFSDGEGRFEIRLPASTAYTLSLAKAGFVPLSLPVRAPSAAGSLEVRLARGAAISGAVVDAAGRPVVGAGVMARPGGTKPGVADTYAYTTTDDRGEYRLAGLAPGRYALFSTRGVDPGGDMADRLDPEMSARLQAVRRELLPRSSPLSETATVELSAGLEATRTLSHSEVAVILPYAQVGGAVTGVLRDASGEPLEGLRVQLWQTSFVGGRLVARPAPGARLSDDRGRYRLFHVPPGRYFVAALPNTVPPGSDAGPSHLPEYYPGRLAIGDAQPIRVGERDEVSGIDITVSHTPGARVHGVALDAAGQPLREGRVMLATSSRAGILLPPRMATIDASGAFEFRDVPPGEHVIRGVAGESHSVEMRISGPPGDAAGPRVIQERRVDVSHPLQVAVQLVDVGSSDVGPLLLRTSPTATLRGRVVFEGDTRSAVSGLAMMAAAANPDYATSENTLMSPLRIAEDGTFEADNLYGPIRILLAPTVQTAWIRSVNVRSVGDPDEPVDVGMTGGVVENVTVVVASTAAAVAGRAVDERSRPVDEYWAIAFSTDPARWFTGSPRVRNAYASGGRFTIPALPPGDYWVAAVDALQGDSVNGEWQNPEFLSGLSASARRITLSESERASVEVSLVRRER